MNLKFRFIAAIAVAAFAFVCAACNSDEPPTPPEPLTDEIRPVLTEGKKWVHKDVWDPYWGNTSENRTTYVKGDAEVDGIIGKSICHINRFGYETQYTAMAEENGVVYESWLTVEYVGDVGYESDKFKYAYEVDPQKDAENPEYGIQVVTIMSKGTVVLMGKTRRAVMVKINRGYNGVLYDYWVEGIGPLFGNTVRHDQILPSTPLYNWLPMYSQLLECYDGDEKIYDYTEFKPELYKPEVVFNELDNNAIEIVSMMIDGSYADKWGDSN